MRFSSLGLITLGAALALTSFVSSASAVVALDQNLNSGWTQGTGTSNGHFAVDTEANGVELGLRASLRFVGPITPTGNLYIAPVGSTPPGRALWNFEFSVNTGSLLNTHSLLTITGPGGIFAFDPTLILDNTPGGGGHLFQNSENLGFSIFPGLNFNPNASGLYTFDLKLFSSAGGSCQIFYFSNSATEANSVRFTVPAAQWTEGRVAVPALGPGYRLRIDPPGTTGTATLAYLRSEARSLWPDFDFTTVPDATSWTPLHDIASLTRYAIRMGIVSPDA